MVKKTITGDYQLALQAIADVFYTAGREAAIGLAKQTFPQEDPIKVVQRVVAYASKGQLTKASAKVNVPTHGEMAQAIESIESKTQKDRRIIALTDEVATLRRLYKEQTRAASGTEAIVQAIHEAVPTMAPISVPPPFEAKGEVEEEELVLALSDFHFGEVVDEAETGGISTYNLDIAKRRFDFTIDKAIVIAKEKMQGYRFRKLHVFLLGDLVSGIIHDELKQNDEVGIVGQMLFATETITAGLLRLAQEFDEVIVTSVVGNHGRVQEKYYFKGKAVNNFDYLISKMIQKLVANQPNLTINVPDSFWAMTTVCNDTFFLTHGDFIRSWAGIPWYGLSRGYLKWRTLAADYGIQFDHMILGHFHNPNVFTMVRGMMIVNGSLKGGDEYSIGAISAACDPVQLMFGMNPNRKGPTHIWHLNSAHIR